VSLLAAEGLTNGAVARRLYISPHTVNTHLRHVFAKLSVPNRVALESGERDPDRPVRWPAHRDMDKSRHRRDLVKPRSGYLDRLLQLPTAPSHLCRTLASSSTSRFRVKAPYC